MQKAPDPFFLAGLLRLLSGAEKHKKKEKYPPWEAEIS